MVWFIGKFFVFFSSCYLDSAWFGMGRHGFARNYMLYQADFLSSVCDPEILLLSDNVSHPLCEYALLLVNYGLAVLYSPLFLSFPTIWAIWKCRCQESDWKRIVR